MKCDKACFPACLQVINTLHHELRNQARGWYNMVYVEMKEYSLTFSIINFLASAVYVFCCGTVAAAFDRFLFSCICLHYYVIFLDRLHTKLFYVMNRHSYKRKKKQEFRHTVEKKTAYS